MAESKLREYKLRIPGPIAEATTANLAAWIDEALEKGVTLAADPGAGPEMISLRLDPQKVVDLANKKRERVPVMLRRLIASHVDIQPAAEEKGKSAGSFAAEVIPENVLPRKLSYSAEDLLPLVRGLDKGMAIAYRRAYGLKELAAAKTPEEDRELAAAMAECCNRRSPAWFLANADLIKLTFVSLRWGMAQTDELDRATADARAAKAQSNGHKSPQAAIPQSARVEPGNKPPATDPVIASAALAEHLEAPVQQEGEF
jgi:hypothetical protein